MRLAFLASSDHERQDRADVKAGQPRDRADRHPLKHHRKSFRGGLRIGVVGSNLGSRFRKRGLAVRAAVTLNVALAVCAKFTGGIVVATLAGHGFSLAFCWEKPENQVAD